MQTPNSQHPAQVPGPHVGGAQTPFWHWRGFGHEMHC